MNKVFQNITDEEIIRLVNSFDSRREILKHLKLRAEGNNYTTLNKFLKKLNLVELLNEKSNKARGRNNTATYTKESFIKRLTKDSTMETGKVKIFILRFKLKEYRCETCGITEWNGLPISLPLHHKDGIHNNHTLENLQFICPNCHSQTDTFAGKSSKKNYNRIIYKCECGNKVSKKGLRCLTCVNKGKQRAERPTNLILMEEIKELGYSAVGRKYGVTDNAIRKWLKSK